MCLLLNNWEVNIYNYYYQFESNTTIVKIEKITIVQSESFECEMNKKTIVESTSEMNENWIQNKLFTERDRVLMKCRKEKWLSKRKNEQLFTTMYTFCLSRSQYVQKT